MKAVLNSALLLLSITVLGCATSTPEFAPSTPEFAPSQVSGPETWGTDTQVTQLRHLYFSNQPDQEALEAAKARDVKVVINLREPTEQNWDEESAAQALGLTYYNVPISGRGPFSAADINRIDELVQLHSNDQILLHCSSGNRAAGWFAIHLVAQHGLQQDAALDIAREAGITKDVIAQRVTRYLPEQGK